MSDVDEIKARLDVVEVVKEYVPLKQAGSNWKGLCPFHNEKSPSFMVSSEKQIWHCFGCGEGGDMFTFVEQIETVDFSESLRILARKANIELRGHDSVGSTKRAQLLDIQEQLTKYWQAQLFSATGESARLYLKQRGLTKETVLAWKIGYAPPAWGDTVAWLDAQGIDRTLAQEAGCVIFSQEKNRWYGRFRDRIMFPLTDHRGSIVGFSGRILQTDADSAKYVNSPQTPIYDKSRLLFGLSQARDAIKEHGYVVLVEGQMDVISSAQAGIQQVVATSGTALTTTQLQLVQRYTDTLLLAFDQDAAGQKAIDRGVIAALGLGFSLKVVPLPAGQDPDAVAMNNPSQWRDMVSGAQPFIEYYTQRVIADHDIATVDGKKQVAKILLPIIAAVSDPVEQDVYVQRLGALLRVSEDSLRTALTQQARPESRNASSAQAETAVAQPKVTAAQIQLQRMLAGLIRVPAFIPQAIDLLPAEQWPEQATETKLYKQLILFYNQHQMTGGQSTTIDWRNQFESFLQSSAPALSHLLEAVIVLSEDMAEQPEVTIRELNELFTRRKRQYLQQHIAQLQHQLHTNNGQAAVDQDSILEQLNSYLKELASLRR